MVTIVILYLHVLAPYGSNPWFTGGSPAQNASIVCLASSHDNGCGIKRLSNTFVF